MKILPFLVLTIILFAKAEKLKDVEINVSAPISRGKEISEDQISIGKNKIVIKQDAEKGTSSSLTRTIDAPVNIIEYDGAGLQLGIGGRGLNPKRTAHYNTRQNGYEISGSLKYEGKNLQDIPIEERNSNELSFIDGIDKDGNVKKIQIYPKKSKAMNIAFDITPAKYVTSLITERGICEASQDGLKKLFK